MKPSKSQDGKVEVLKVFVGYKESGRKVIPGINLHDIETYEDENGDLIIKDVVRKKWMEAGQYLEFLHIQRNMRELTFQALKLPAVKKILQKPPGLELLEVNGHFCLPEREDMFLPNREAEEFANNLRISKDKQALLAKDNELWEILYPKQRTDYIATLGIPLQNQIITKKKLEILLTLMEAYGVTETAKSWTMRVGLKQWWGNFNTPLMGDAIGTDFRGTYWLSITTLPIMIDEANSVKKIIDMIKGWATKSKTGRGTKEGKMKDLVVTATPILTANSDVLAEDMSVVNLLATDRRAYKNHHTQQERELMEGKHDIGKKLEASLKSGGLVYHLLKDHTAEVLETAINYYYDILDGDTALMGILLASPDKQVE